MIEIKKLECGVRVVMDKTDYVQSVAIGFWIKTGAVDENAKYAGISHFIEHMMFKGTHNRSAKDIAEDVDKIGGQINAFTGKEATCYYMKTISTNLIKSSDILLDMLTNSKFETKEMAREKKVICEEIKMIQDTPDDDAHDMISRIVNRGNPLGNSIAGTPTSLNNISKKIMKKYFEDEYTRDNIVISIAGNFNKEEICEYLEDKFGSFKARKEEKKHKLLPYEPGYKVKVKDIEQSHFFIGTEGVPITDKSYHKMLLLSNIMGGSMSSRLFQSIREQKGLAYSVYGMNSSSALGGYFSIYAGVSHKNLTSTIEAIKEELFKLSNEGVMIDELNKAKEQMKASFIFGMENMASRMFSAGRSLLLTGKVRSDKEVLEIIDKISLDEINNTTGLITDVSKYSGAAVTDKRIDFKRILTR